MPRIRKPKYTHVFVVAYPYQNIDVGTKCNIIRESYSRERDKMVTVELENGETAYCFAHRITPIEIK